MQKKLKFVIVIQLIILIGSFMFFVLQDTGEQRMDVPMEQWNSDYIEFKNGVWQAPKGQLDFPVSMPLIESPEFLLPKGNYTVTIQYDCDEDQSMQLYAPGSGKHYIKANEIKLDKNLSMTSYQFRVIEDVDDFEVIVYYQGKESFVISNVIIEKNHDTIGRILFYMLSAFVVMDLGILFYRSSMERRKYMLSIFGITLAASLPLFYQGLYHGHDLMFHLTRIEGIAKELRLGNFPIRITSVWLGEYGYPTSIYYGELLLYFPALLRILGFTVTESYKIFVFSVNLVTVLIAEWSFRGIFKDKKISILLAMAYSTASYRMVNIYVRSAVGEMTAWMFIPLIALAVYKFYTDNDTIKKNFVHATIMALGMSGLILTHLLSAEMIVFVLAVICLIYFKKTLSVTVIRSYMIAVIETVLLCAGFLVPFFDYSSNVSVQITDKVTSGGAIWIQYKGANLGEFFSFFSNPFGEDWSQIFLSPGILLMLVLFLAILLWSVKKTTKLMKQMIIMAVILLFMSTNAFPWDSLAHDSMIFNLLAQVQFPWRYIGLAVVFITLLWGIMLKETDWRECFGIEESNFVKISVVIVIVMTCIFISHHADTEERWVYYDTADVDTYYISGEEYLRNETDLKKLTGKIESQDVTSIDMTARKGCEMDIRCVTGRKNGYIILPVFNYKGYVVTDDAGNKYDVIDSDNNLVSFHVPANFDGNLYLRFAEPWYWTAAFGVSVVSAMIILGIGVTGKIKYKKLIKLSEGKL